MKRTSEGFLVVELTPDDPERNPLGDQQKKEVYGFWNDW